MWLAFYAFLLAAAIISTYRDQNLKMVSFALALSWMLSNASIHFIAPEGRPAFYTVSEISVALMAYFACIGGSSRMMLVLVGVCALSIASNVAFSAVSSPTVDQLVVWQIITNICFAVECVLAGWAGERARGRLDWRFAFRRGTAPRSAARKAGR